MSFMAFQTLNRMKWTGKLGSARISIVHRGAPDDAMWIDGMGVKEVKKSYFTYENCGRETFIPMHRVRRIESGGKTVWKRKT